MIYKKEFFGLLLRLNSSIALALRSQFTDSCELNTELISNLNEAGFILKRLDSSMDIFEIPGTKMG